MIKNRRYNDFLCEEQYTAGIVLVGREVKFLACNEADLTGSRVLIKESPILAGCFIKAAKKDDWSAPYEENRDRTLLLTKSEIRKLKESLKKGYYLIPKEIIKQRGKYKLVFGVGRPMKKWDKREKEKERQIKKEYDY